MLDNKNKHEIIGSVLHQMGSPQNGWQADGTNEIFCDLAKMISF